MQLKIAILHFGFFYSGGGEKLVLEQVRGLRRRGHSVECFAPYVDRSDCFPDYPEMAEVRSLLPSPPSWLPLKDALWVLACCLLIPLMAGRFRRFDVLMGANQPSGWFAFVLGFLLRRPYVIYLAQPLRLLHPREIDRRVGLRIRDGDQSFVRFLSTVGRAIIDWADRVSVRSAAAVLTNGDHVGRWIHSVYGRPTLNCPAGCHPFNQEKLASPRRWTGRISIAGHDIRKPYILLTNRHAPQKRFEYALWGLKTVVRHVPGIELVITGQETQYTEQLRYLTNSLNLARNVRFVGLVDEAELAKLYANAALYVYPSPEEDYGMGIVEAMGAGTPVVAWKNGGPTVTVVDGHTGFLVPPYDTDGFAEKMLLLVTHPELAMHMGQAGHRRARDQFSYEHHMAVLERALIEVRDARAWGTRTPSFADEPFPEFEVDATSRRS